MMLRGERAAYCLVLLPTATATAATPRAQTRDITRTISDNKYFEAPQFISWPEDCGTDLRLAPNISPASLSSPVRNQETEMELQELLIPAENLTNLLQIRVLCPTDGHTNTRRPTVKSNIS